jgi:hypothetical protein
MYTGGAHPTRTKATGKSTRLVAYPYGV